MSLQVEKLENNMAKLTIEVPADDLEKALQSAYMKQKNKIAMPGFRKGKVPRQMIEKMYGPEIFYDDAANALIPKAYSEAYEECELEIVSRPEINVVQIEKGKSFIFTADVATKPEVKLGEYKGLEVDKVSTRVTQKEVDAKIQEEAEKNAREVVVTDRAVADGDEVILDFEGFVDGEAFEGGSAQDYSVELGAGRMLKDFEEGLVGMKAGEEKIVDVAFPENYHAENLKGQTAQFKLTMNRVRESVLPVVDGEFIKKFGVEDGSVDTFRAEVRKNMQRELGNTIKAQIKQQVMDGLADLHAVDVPKALVSDEIRYIREEFSQSMGGSANNMPDELFAPQAERRVKLGLIVGEVIRQHNLQRDPARVDAMLENVAATYEDPQALKDYYRTNRQAMQTIEAAVMEEMIVDWVLEKATVNDETRDFDAVMNPQKQAQA